MILATILSGKHIKDVNSVLKGQTSTFLTSNPTEESSELSRVTPEANLAGRLEAKPVALPCRAAKSLVPQVGPLLDTRLPRSSPVHPQGSLLH